MTKLAQIQEAILQLDHNEQERLRIWLDEKAIDLEEDSPELEAELLKAVQGPHSPLVKADLEAVAERALRKDRARGQSNRVCLLHVTECLGHVGSSPVT